MAVKKAMISIDSHTYKLVIAKKIDIIEAIILNDIEYFSKGRGYVKKNKTIAEELNVSLPTVTRKIANLIEYNFIESKKLAHCRLLKLTPKYKEYVSNQIEEAQQKNDVMSNQNDEACLIKLISLPNQNDEAINKEEENIEKNIDNIQDNIKMLKIIFSKYYQNFSSRFSKKLVDLQLKKQLKKYSFEKIKIGFENYLITQANLGCQLQFIKNVHSFLLNEMFLDYQKQVKYNPVVNSTKNYYEKETLGVDDQLYTEKVTPVDKKKVDKILNQMRNERKESINKQ
ncbi:hypothetical protein [Mycoplasma sp. P36-A1]|uniref:hypothetical protein n=1 Tax=Mycoplasma sp. P36-A1 TaxID=3252900 RepID=UPI003C2F25D2